MPWPKMMLAKPLSQERYQSKGRYGVAHLSGLLKRIEGNLVAGPYAEYFVPPVVIPGLSSPRLL